MLFIICFLAFHTLAQAEESISPEMRSLEINLMNENFSSLGLYEYLDTSTVPEGLLDFDQAYVTGDSEEFILVKFAGPTNESKFEKISSDEGTVLNFTTRWGNLVSLYIDSTDENKVLQIQTALGLTQTSLWQVLVPQAHALPCDKKVAPQGVGYQSLVRSCVGTALSSAGKSVSSTAKSIWSAIKNPKSIRQYWNDAKKQFVALKKAISEMTKTVPEFISSLKGLKPNVQTDVACAWIGSLVPDMLISLATGGAGLSKLLAKIAIGIKKMKGLSKTIQSFKRMGHRIPEKAQSQILTGAIACGI